MDPGSETGGYVRVLLLYDKISETQVGELYRQIGQLKVENDFLARRLGK
jgi:hypothetical protein